MALTDTFIKALKPGSAPKKHSDGAGLHLLLTVQGSRLWRLAYRFGSKQKLLALGTYPAVSLQDARRKRDYAKKLLATGTDPAHQTKLERINKQMARAETFGGIADEFLTKVEREGNRKRIAFLCIYCIIGHRKIINSQSHIDALPA